MLWRNLHAAKSERVKKSAIWEKCSCKTWKCGDIWTETSRKRKQKPQIYQMKCVSSQEHSLCKGFRKLLMEDVSVWSNMNRRESEERWHKKMLKSKVASLLLPRLQVTVVSHLHNEIVAKISCMLKWISSIDWTLASVYQSPWNTWAPYPWSQDFEHVTRHGQKHKHRVDPVFLDCVTFTCISPLVTLINLEMIKLKLIRSDYL